MRIYQKVTFLVQKHRNLLLYGVIGSLSAGLDYIVFMAIMSTSETPYIFANIISVTTGIITSFTLNRKYNFKVTDRVVHRLSLFFMVGIGGLIVSSILLYLFIEYVELNEPVSKVLSLLLVVIFQYIFNKLITFKSN